MTLPRAVRAGVESALESELGRQGVAVEEASPVSGGCISPTARVRTGTGDVFFLKWGGADLPDALLPAEARGLRELAGAGAVRVPEVIAVGGGVASTGRDDGVDPDLSVDSPPWLLLEWLEPGTASSASWERLGRELAALHRTRADRFGAHAPNFIGSLPQENDPSGDWPEFWRDRRLAPQAEMATAAGLLNDDDRHRLDALYTRLPDLLGPAADDGPSLLHGDLWNGNVHMVVDGTPAVIDPSVYHGHREVDLAMAELFGGFGRGFRTSYEESWPLAPGYAPVRRAVYQLYYLLVHVNLFGRSYVPRTRNALADTGV